MCMIFFFYVRVTRIEFCARRSWLRANRVNKTRPAIFIGADENEIARRVIVIVFQISHLIFRLKTTRMKMFWKQKKNDGVATRRPGGAPVCPRSPLFVSRKPSRRGEFRVPLGSKLRWIIHPRGKLLIAVACSTYDDGAGNNPILVFSFFFFFHIVLEGRNTWGK